MIKSFPKKFSGPNVFDIGAFVVYYILLSEGVI